MLGNIDYATGRTRCGKNARCSLLARWMWTNPQLQIVCCSSVHKMETNGLCGAEVIIKSLKIVYWIFDSVVHTWCAICARARECGPVSQLSHRFRSRLWQLKLHSECNTSVKGIHRHTHSAAVRSMDADVELCRLPVCRSEERRRLPYYVT